MKIRISVKLKLIVGVLIFVLMLASAPSVQAAPLQVPIDCTTQAFMPKVECNALVDFYNSTNGGSWTADTDWLTNVDPCTWMGITCSGSAPSKHVTEISITGNNLTGSIPNTIGNLSFLTSVGLWNNTLAGEIPASIGNLTSLTYLSLDSNNLSGNIPWELANLINLTDLYFYDNPNLTWTIPPGFIALPNLVYFQYENTELCAPNTYAYSTWETAIGSELSTTGNLCDPIFADGFESGNLNGWPDNIAANIPEGAYVAEAACKLCVTNSASMV
ncbi:MAG: hypothetical protein N2D54_02150, partial [Chloroflexota bacterium]